MGLQAGAAKVAASNGIVSVKLSRDSTTRDYVMSFLQQTMAGVSDSIFLSEAVHTVLYGPDGRMKEDRKGAEQ